LKILLKSIGSDTPALIADPGDPIEARGSAWPVSCSATSWVYIKGKVVPIDKKHFFYFSEVQLFSPGWTWIETDENY